MGLFDKKKQTPIEEVRQADTSTLLEYIDGSNYVAITEDNVLQIPSIKNAIDLISGTVASLEVNLYDGKGKKVEDDRLFLLNNEPNDFEVANKFKREIVKDMLLNGKSYTFIDKKGIKVNGLHFLKSNEVTKTDIVNKNGIIVDKRYNFVLNNISLEKNFYNVLEVEYGKGVLRENSTTLETLIHLSNYDNYIFRNATLPSGILETDGRLTQEGAKNIKTQLETLYSGAKNFFRPLVLEQGLKWKTIQQNPNDLMLDKAKESAIKDVEQMFNLPYGMFNNKTNQSTIDQNKLFLDRCLTPILVALEESFNKNLLLESEKKKGYYFRFDISQLLRLSPLEMLEFVQGLENGSYIDHETACIMLDQEPMDKEPIQEPKPLIEANKGIVEGANIEEGNNADIQSMS